MNKKIFAVVAMCMLAHGGAFAAGVCAATCAQYKADYGQDVCDFSFSSAGPRLNCESGSGTMSKYVTDYVRYNCCTALRTSPTATTATWIVCYESCDECRASNLWKTVSDSHLNFQSYTCTASGSAPRTAGTSAVYWTCNTGYYSTNGAATATGGAVTALSCTQCPPNAEGVAATTDSDYLTTIYSGKLGNGATAIGQCYIPKNSVGADVSGGYTFDDKCPY